VCADHILMRECTSSYLGINNPFADEYAEMGAKAGVLNGGSGAIATYPNDAFLYMANAMLIHNGLMGPSSGFAGMECILDHCHAWQTRNMLANFHACGEKVVDCDFEPGSASTPTSPYPQMLYDGGDDGVTPQTVVCPANGFTYPALTDCKLVGASGAWECITPNMVGYGLTNEYSATYQSSGWPTDCCLYAVSTMTGNGGQTPSEPRFETWIGTNLVEAQYGTANGGNPGPYTNTASTFSAVNVVAASFTGSGTGLTNVPQYNVQEFSGGTPQTGYSGLSAGQVLYFAPDVTGLGYVVSSPVGSTWCFAASTGDNGLILTNHLNLSWVQNYGTGIIGGGTNLWFGWFTNATPGSTSFGLIPGSGHTFAGNGSASGPVYVPVPRTVLGTNIWYSIGVTCNAANCNPFVKWDYSAIVP
jgi:hypothetical protein